MGHRGLKSFVSIEVTVQAGSIYKFVTATSYSWYTGGAYVRGAYNSNNRPWAVINQLGSECAFNQGKRLFDFMLHDIFSMSRETYTMSIAMPMK